MIKKKLATAKNKPPLLFTVSGVLTGTKLDKWIASRNLPIMFMSTMKHVSLRGRKKPEELTLYDRIMLKIGRMKNPDPVARREEMYGLDFIDKSSIALIIEFAKQFEMSSV